MNISSLVLVLICVAIGYILEPIFFSDSETIPKNSNTASTQEKKPEPSKKTVTPTGFSPKGSDPIITLMKASIAAGKITEFQANQVTEWKVGGNIQMNGKSYQTGIATFTAVTSLGEQKNNAMALIENGAIVKWVWANKRNLEMR